MQTIKGFLEKFHIPRRNIIWGGICTILSLFIYLIMLRVIGEANATNTTVHYFYYVMRDVSLVVFTILVTSLLTSLFIEKRSRNEQYADFVLYDFLSNPNIYTYFEDAAKRTMLDNLQNQLLFHGVAPIKAMHKSIQERLEQIPNDEKPYYFEYCRTDMRCSVSNGIITKHIKRIIKVRSYDKSRVINGYTAANVGTDSLVEDICVQKVKVNGKEAAYTLDADGNGRGGFYPRSMEARRVILKEPLHLSSDRDTELFIEYTIRIYVSDNVTTCRVSVPCKEFRVYFNLNDSSEYRLISAAFGFQDHAVEDRASTTDNSVSIAFTDWIYRGDGVIVTLSPRYPAAPGQGQEQPEIRAAVNDESTGEKV